MEVILEKIYEIVISPVWTKIFINFLFLVYCFYVKRKKDIPEIKIFMIISATIFIKDIVNIFLLTSLLPVTNIITDILIITTYLFWLRIYTGSKKKNKVFFIINLTFVVFIVTNALLNYLNLNLSFYLRLFVVADIIFLAVKLYGVTEYNTENPGIILENRKRFLLFLFIYNILVIIAGNNREIIGVSITEETNAANSGVDQPVASDNSV